MYEEINEAFAKHWKARSGIAVSVNPARSKSGIPVSVVMDGLDVVTLALFYDAEALKKSITFTLPDTHELFPKSSPYTSTVVFLVRKGNPKQIKDWGDLVQPGVQVLTPNPGTSDDARWNYLAAWGYARYKPGG
ncbi:MAG: substrate-binding domain-containing protein, partial [Bacteroidota bacterium]|nr:substrate-binding domain-containing protein [Bacteroidota bacterium]